MIVSRLVSVAASMGVVVKRCSLSLALIRSSVAVARHLVDCQGVIVSQNSLVVES